jgi:hypothetical protein
MLFFFYFLNMVMAMVNSKITMQSVLSGKVLAKNIPHPFSCYLSTTRLNPDAFVCLKGEYAYEEYSWERNGNDFGVDIGCGSSVDIHQGNVDLYENNDSITVVLLNYCQGYRYPKEYFKLIESPQFEDRVKHMKLKDKLSELEKKYPKAIFDSIKKTIIETQVIKQKKK